MQTVITIFTALIGGGVVGLVQFLIQRNDARHDRNSEVLAAISRLDAKVNGLEETISEREAVLARTHILRFMDELYNGQHHTSEYFEQTLDDINTYHRFCEKHETFGNGRTEAAAEYIKKEYERLFSEHKL